ncbi:hypothetical protein [Acinetobacter haemolyticus]|uniref:hypothetical protein n=1 Tax=Acinetobacter haemolyticus TaxID=29430 RepID=UPI000D697813|nr:hypothetical protein [Acinetobacter haemolyticus]
MASTASERQKERHNRMLEKGFKKRAFYVNEDTLKKITEYKEANKLDSLDEALNDFISKTVSKI